MCRFGVTLVWLWCCCDFCFLRCGSCHSSWAPAFFFPEQRRPRFFLERFFGGVGRVSFRKMGVSSGKQNDDTVSKVRLSVDRTQHYANDSVHPVVAHLRDKHGPERWCANDLHFFTHSRLEEQFVQRELLPLKQPFTRHAWLISSTRDTDEEDARRRRLKQGKSQDIVMVVYILHLETTLVLLKTFPALERDLAAIPSVVDKTETSLHRVSMSHHHPSISIALAQASSNRPSHSPAATAAPPPTPGVQRGQQRRFSFHD